MLLLAAPALANDFPVANTADLVAALNPTTGAQDNDTITFQQNVTLTQQLPAVQNSVTIVGQNHTLSGNNQFRGFFVARWTPGTATQVPVTVAIQDLTIQNAKAQGGSGGEGSDGGGGGGAGLGGALFVAALANVTLTNVSLSNDIAPGGDGGGTTPTANTGGGGGGLGGNGGDAAPTQSGGGGGGLGLGANGGPAAPDNSNPGVNGASGIATGASGGASGANGAITNGGSGGSAGGGGGGGGAVNRDGGGGGVGGVGTTGGFGGGGGGGGGADLGGTGGFGGGGAGGGGLSGAGGFGGGGGGGGAGDPGGAGGFGAGNGSPSSGGGGGGLGAGGAVFVQQGGALSVAGPLTVNGNTVTGGSGSTSGAGNGSAVGSGIFVQGNDAGNGGSGSLTLSPASGQTQTISDAIADQTGSGGSGGNAGAWGLTKSGSGTTLLTGTNTYTGLTAVNAGTLEVNGLLAHTGAGVQVSSGATLAGTGIVGDLDVLGTLAPGRTLDAPHSVGTLTTGDVVMNSGAHYAVQLRDGGGADLISATGPVDLGNSHLELSRLTFYVHTPGNIYVIVQSGGGVSGTFAGLPQGATVKSGNAPFTISYNPNTVTLTATAATPTVATSASPSTTIGHQIRDAAELTGGVSPTGTMTFRAYGPNDDNCAGPPVFTSTKTTSGNGSHSSGHFTPNDPGIYHWTARYSGDSANSARTSPCSSRKESTWVEKASPTLDTTAKLTDARRIVDTAKLRAGHNPSGEIAFKLYGPNDASCSRTPVFTDRATVSGNGGYQSRTFAPTAPGTYRFTAVLPGDANNRAARSECNTPGESVTVR